MDVFEELGLDTKVVEEVKEQTVMGAFEALPSDVYKGEVKQLATFVTEKGATQMIAIINVEVKGEKEGKDITVYQNVKKKDGEANPIGQAIFKHILDACNVTASDITVKVEKIKAYGKEVEGKLVKGLSGRKITAFVRAVFEEGAKYENYNEIEAYGRPDGTNSKGEDLIETFKEKIEKTPVLNRKSKDAGKVGTQAAKTEAAADVDGML